MPLYTRILFLVALAYSYCADAQVVAGFTASPPSGCVPLVVSFANTSTPVTGTTYKWDLGNSTGLITLTNPSTSYLAAGTYTVTLTATNGGVSNIHSQVIVVYPQPIPNFTVSDTALCPGAPFTFTSTGSAGMAGGMSYLWSFGDGYTATTSPTVHAYDLPGRFNISLTATNAAGCSNTKAISSLIHAYTPPVPIFSASPRHVCKHSGNVSFTSSPAGTAPFTYRWSFGDGSPSSTAANPTHFYSAPGYYAVKLVVADAHGCMDSLTEQAYISVTTLVAGISGPDSGCVYSPVTFLNASTNFLTDVWMYGNGGSDTTRNGHTSYDSIRAYTVQVVASDSFCHDTAYKTFVIPRRITDFTVPEWLCPSPVPATYSVSVPAGSSVAWSFSDGSGGTGASIIHTYMSDTIFFVTMVATSSLGCRDTVTKREVVLPMFLSIGRISAGGCIPFMYHGGATALTVVPPSHAPSRYPDTFVYTWDMGDGSPPLFGTDALHTYTAAGVYYVSISTVSGHGCRATAMDSAKAGTQPHAIFTVTPTHICYRDSAIFTRMLVSGPANKYEWHFGEGAYGIPLIENSLLDTEKVEHRFTLPGLLSDTLITSYNLCPDTFILTRNMTVDSPKAIGIPKVICSPPNSVFFTDSSLGANSIEWIFGDGTTSSSTHVTHTFPAAGLYSNLLTTYNRLSGCRDTSQIYVDLAPSVFTVLPADTAICNNNFVTFTIKLVSGSIDSIVFHPVDRAYIIKDYFPPVLVDTFHAGGLRTITTVGFDIYRCPVTVTTNVLVADPVPHITVTPSSLCWPQITRFNDGVIDPGGIPIVHRAWTFGDGNIATTSDTFVFHRYAATGTYNVKEYVTDSMGCFDSGSVTRTLYSALSLFTAPVHGCRGIDVPFVNWSTPSSSSYLWLFGDGATSTIDSQTHMYTDTGRYTVKLFVTDPHGCRDTSSQVITVTHPHAAFSLSDSVGICPPLTVSFLNTSLRSATYLWNLGNGTSVAKNPVNVYPVPGFDTVSLIAIDSFGCRDTAVQRHVKVFGYSGAFTYSADSGCIPLAITFDANLSNTALASAITWDFRDGVTSPPSLSDTVTHRYLIPGGYVPQLIIRDHSGCSSFNIGRDTIKVDGVTPGFEYNPDPVCIRNKVHLLDTSKSYWSRISSWRWTIGGVVTSRDTTSAIFAVAGTYPAILHVTDAWGCSADDTQTITVYALPAITPDAMLCTRQTMIFADSVTGGAWSSGSPAVATVGSASGMATGISAGIASITYTVGGTCYTTIAVTVNAYPDSGIISGDSAVCLGESVQLSESVTGGAWSASNTNASISSSGMLKAFTAGKDTVMYTVTNAGCSTAALKEVIIFPLPDPGTISGKDTLCRDAMTSLIETDTTGYWSSGSPSVAAIDSSGHIHGLIAGSATITFTVGPDSNDCSNTAAFPVVVINTDITVTPAVTGVKCYDERDGSITLTINSGTPPFNVVWSTGDTTSALDSLPAGAYSVIISEPATNCTLQQSFIVPSPDSLRVTAEVINDVCERPNGSIKLIPQGGTSPYHFAWSNKSVAAEIANIPSGAYACTITDLNGCSTQFAITVVDSTCPDIIIHDGVSPNGDGINDTWVIEGLWRYPGNVVKLFDKWGDEIFEEANYKNDWNGSGGKGPVPDGTYYYLLKLNSPYPPHGKDAYTGSLLLKR